MEKKSMYKKIMNNRSLQKDPPKFTKWVDLLERIIKRINEGMTYSQIAKELDVNANTLKSILHYYRHMPEWTGKIPYIVRSQRLTEEQRKDRIGVMDIETHGGLVANRGFILSYVIKEHKKNLYYSALIDPKHIRQGYYDKFVCQKFVKDILNFDVLVGYYSGDRHFDFPFARTRCAFNGVEFPYYQTIRQIDLYPQVKNKLKLTRNTLEEACKVFGIKGKTHIDFNIWRAFVFEGNKKAGQEILAHNVLDCNITDKLFIELKKYSACGLLSI